MRQTGKTDPAAKLRVQAIKYLLSRRIIAQGVVSEKRIRAYFAEIDYGRKISQCLELGLQQIHGQKKERSVEFVPLTWWDHFKMECLPTLYRWGWIRWNARPIVKETEASYVFPLIDDIEEGIKAVAIHEGKIIK